MNSTTRWISSTLILVLILNGPSGTSGLGSLRAFLFRKGKVGWSGLVSSIVLCLHEIASLSQTWSLPASFSLELRGPMNINWWETSRGKIVHWTQIDKCIEAQKKSTQRLNAPRPLPRAQDHTAALQPPKWQQTHLLAIPYTRKITEKWMWLYL